MSALGVTLATGAALGAVYALVGAAIALVAVTSRTLHLAVGQLLVAGVLVQLVLALEVVTGLGPVAAGTLAVIAGAAVSALLVPLVVRPLPRGLATLVGLAVAGGVVEALVARTLGTRTVRPAPLLELPVAAGLDGAVVAAVALGVPGALLLVAVLRWTRWGRQLRVVGGSPRAAELAGISPARTEVAAFALAGAVAVLAGLLVAPIVFVGVGQGASLTVRGVAAAALLGRVGPIGALPAGLLLGLAEAASQAVWPQAGGDVAVALVVVLVLVARGAEEQRAWGRAW